jgi:hypothetical protein
LSASLHQVARDVAPAGPPVVGGPTIEASEPVRRWTIYHDSTSGIPGSADLRLGA